MSDKLKPHERYNIPNADVLFEDTWAEEDELDVCPKCGRSAEGALICPDCGSAMPVCSGVCGACSSAECVGGKRQEGNSERTDQHGDEVVLALCRGLHGLLV